MTTVSLAEAFEGTVHEAETCWYDTSGWPSWVDGLERVIEVSGNWPEASASVTWQSGPAGRGTVTERVTSYEPLSGQALQVQDDSITGRQGVAFRPVDDGVEVILTLDYEIRRRSIVTGLVDFLFIRRAMATSMRTTLARFGAELAGARATGRT